MDIYLFQIGILFFTFLLGSIIILLSIRRFWNSTTLQRWITPENPWSSLIWLTLVIQNGLLEYREKSRCLEIDIDNSILLSGVLTAFLSILETTEFIDKSKPLKIINQDHFIIYIVFKGSLTYIFTADQKNQFVIESYSRLFIRSYERYNGLFGGNTI